LVPRIGLEPMTLSLKVVFIKNAEINYFYGTNYGTNYGTLYF